MDIHQLKTFVTVAREGSITLASDLLCSHQRFLSEATRIKGVLSGSYA